MNTVKETVKTVVIGILAIVAIILIISITKLIRLRSLSMTVPSKPLLLAFATLATALSQ